MNVIDIVSRFMIIVPVSYGLQGVFFIANASLNAINKPVYATGLTLAQMIVIYIPLATILSGKMGLDGIFLALSLAYSLSGILGYIVIMKSLVSKGD